MIKFEYQGVQKSLIKVIVEKYERITYVALQKILRKKDIKINGLRINRNIDINSGDIIEIFAPLNVLTGEILIKPIYEDQNILIVEKPINIEVSSQSSTLDLGYFVNKYLNSKLETAKPCHRLDRNTAGLVIFTKNDMAYNEIYKALKDRTLEKYYLAIVNGNFVKQSDTLTNYLFKDENLGKSFISNSATFGSEKIITKYTVLKEKQDYSLLQIKLVTGKTHQIRAHMAHIKHSVVGDSKYSTRTEYSATKYKNQLLWAYKIKFNFVDTLVYLNDKVIQLDTLKIYEIFDNL
ncbi:MAG: RluA family pseudouridine synthase [Clostridia bacterium]|nr:RluA family pseudouridine synthase [Clostridia bacterium]